MDDASLYVPWNSLSGMETELNTMTRIHKKNMHQIYELCDEVEKFPISNLTCPVNVEECVSNKKLFVEEEKKNVHLFNQYNSEYSLLLNQEAQLLKQIGEFENATNQLATHLNKLEDEQMMIKKSYQSTKFALNIAKDVFERSFDMNVKIENFNCDEKFASEVTLRKNDSSVPFTIKVSSTGIDFDTTSIARDKLEKLKDDFKKTNNTLVLISAYKNLTEECLVGNKQNI